LRGGIRHGVIGDLPIAMVEPTPIFRDVSYLYASGAQTLRGDSPELPARSWNNAPVPDIEWLQVAGTVTQYWRLANGPLSLCLSHFGQHLSLRCLHRDRVCRDSGGVRREERTAERRLCVGGRHGLGRRAVLQSQIQDSHTEHGPTGGAGYAGSTISAPIRRSKSISGTSIPRSSNA
jgi:hypothetical protein